MLFQIWAQANPRMQATRLRLRLGERLMPTVGPYRPRFGGADVKAHS